MIVLTFPWHWVGILGMPRRMAYLRLHRSRRSQPQAFSVTLSAIGGFILRRCRACCSSPSWSAAMRAPRADAGALSLQPSPCIRRARPAALNGFALWVGADDRPDRHQLRLSDRCSSRSRQEPRCRPSTSGAQR